MRALTLYLAASMLMISHQAYAQTVQPMAFELSSVGENAHETITLNNTTSEKLTIEITISKINIDEDGIEISTPSDDDFIVFPPTAIVEPGNTQAFRVQYIGASDLTHSEAYRVAVKEVPVDLSGSGESRIQVLVNFQTLVNVVPPGAVPNAIVEMIGDEVEPGYWDVRLRNSGNRYVRLIRTEWVIENGNGETVFFSGQDLVELNKKALLLPNSVQTIRVPAPDSFSFSDSIINVSLIQ